MPTTLNPTCPLCGLRYTGRPLLELHIREDHRPRDRHADAEPVPGDQVFGVQAMQNDMGAAVGQRRGPIPQLAA